MNGHFNDASLALTTGALSTCLGVGTDDITNLIQTGADNSKTFETQTTMGFTFYVSDTVVGGTNDTNYLAGGTY